MKRRKSIISLLIVMCLMSMSLCGCSKPGQNDEVEEPTEDIIAEENTDEFIALAEDSYQERAIARGRNLSRIQKVMERAANGEAITIGFIGGSITMGSGASSSSKCYAELVFDWWVETFPEADFTFINAGIGATDSKFACARCEDDLLQYNPDFVIVEFSVNDSSDQTFSESYESLVRKILTYETEPAVMLLNMVTYDTGYSAQDIHNVIAFRYDIPAVSMKNSIYADIEAGILQAKDVSSDMTHPNDRGHAYAAQIVTYFLEKVRLQGFPEDYYTDYVLPDPVNNLISITSSRLRNDTLQAELNGFAADMQEQNSITDVFRRGYEAYTEGDSISFTVEGSVIMLQYRKTKDMTAPTAMVIIDGDEENAITVDGNYPNGWGDWLYLDTVYRGTSGIHSVEIRLTSTGTKSFYLVSVVTAGQ